MTKPVIIVGGLGRSGSSLTCQMLHAGGIEPVGGTYPFWEAALVTSLPDEHEWIREAGGKFVKILHAHRFTPPANMGARVIWTDRSINHQIESWRKIGRRLYGIEKQPSVAEIKERLLNTKPMAKEALRKAARPGFLMNVRFEELLRDPAREARRMQCYLDRPLDIEAMAAVVEDRGPETQKKMLEARLISDRTGRVLES